VRFAAFPTLGLTLTLALALTTACEARVQVDLDVHAGGDGTLTVSVGLDDEVMAEVGDLGDVLEVDDLTERGWVISEPAKEDDGFTWVRATRAFDSAAEATAVLDEVSGPDGPFGTLALTHDRDLLTTRYSLTGAVDLRAGLEAFSDSALVAALDGTPFGVTTAELEERAGRPLDEAVKFGLSASLPGELRSNAPVPSPDRAVWEPRLGSRAAVTATGERFNVGTVVWGAIAVAAALALVVLVAVRLARRSP
jgi:hypothetical protein